MENHFDFEIIFHYKTWGLFFDEINASIDNSDADVVWLWCADDIYIYSVLSSMHAFIACTNKRTYFWLLVVIMKIRLVSVRLTMENSCLLVEHFFFVELRKLSIQANILMDCKDANMICIFSFTTSKLNNFCLWPWDHHSLNGS